MAKDINILRLEDAQEEPSTKKTNLAPHGFVDFNIYNDSRNFRTVTVNTLLTNLLNNKKLSYFSFLTLDTERDGDAFDVDSYITEQNLFYRIGNSPVDLTTQYFSITGQNNDIWRSGLNFNLQKTPVVGKWIKKIVSDGFYMIDYYPVQVDHLDGYNWQIQQVWRFPVLPKTLHNRVYMYGFADHNFGGEGHNKLVCENQIGVRLYKQLYAIAEYRWNGFFPEGDRTGLALGMEYNVRF